ncbi:LuxR family transcriptional regulator [Goodfellowiella coeruleoviolacea]|uniref:Regulatory protein, luxR family n=1 Tax=Goodfellowiella coeruleoviolacea TaxID=334858 RepID=A0AAE3KDF5_9PSEU|nr:LuxR family transcriptional regulator [Goodfellowiella coeruleoviolacea]MCP2164001.1 regulatory protein, luxR family [Goodfellowiella coeruleoviolacea]
MATSLSRVVGRGQDTVAAWRDVDALDVLVERTEQVELLERLVSGLADRNSAAVVVRGRPGTGRSELLRRAGELARAHGVRVISAAGSPEESSLRYGVVSQLLGALRPVGCPLWTHPMWTDPSRDAELLPMLCRDFLSVARKAPLLVVVDDAQWADAHSVRWLQAMARRLSDVPLMLLLSLTSGSAAEDAQLPSTVSAAVVPATHLIDLRPLSAAGVRQVLAAAHTGPVPEAFAAATAQITGGNAAVLHAVLRHFARAGLAPTAAQVPQVRASAVRAVGERVDRLLAGIPAGLVDLLRVLAVCGGHLDFELMLSLAGPRARSASGTLDLLARTGLVRLHGGNPELVDATTAARVLAGMSASDRAELYARAAQLAHRCASADEGLASLLLGARPIGEPWAVEVLRRAAAHSREHGQPHRAGELLARALREPLDPVVRAQLVVELAVAGTPSFPAAGDRRLGELISEPGGDELAPFRLRAADLLLARGEAELVRQHLARAVHTSETPALLALYWLAENSSPDDAGLTSPDLASVPPLPDRPTDPGQAGAAAWRLAARGQDRDRAGELARAALHAGDLTGAPLCPRVAASRALMLGDDRVEALAGLDQVLADANRLGATSVAALVLGLRASVGLRFGQLDEAERDLGEALRRVPLRDWHPRLAPGALAVAVLLHLRRGEPGQAERALAEFAAHQPDGAVQGAAWSYLLFARGRLRLAVGDASAALADLRECGRELLARGWTNPALLPWRSVAALAHHALGEQSAAARLLAEEQQLAAAWGAAGAVRVAELAAATVLGGPDRTRTPAVPRPDPATQLLVASRAAPGRQGEPEPATGPAPVRPLTEAENRIVQLAVRGYPNSRIAQELAVTRRTVEQHLTRVYHKLGIPGRHHLGPALRHTGGRAGEED